MSTSKNYLLTLLAVILAFNYIDRVAVGILLQDIKADLDLSDTQLGALTGIAFAFFYAVMGIPIARWADRGNRVTIITLTTALWSVAVALCGAATNFVQLLLMRMTVAIGEAGCYPSGLSFISDSFTREERPRAVARYMLGIPIAAIVGNFAAGWLNEFYGWRATFVAFGLPGFVLAALAAFTLKEPRHMQAAAATQTQPSLKAVLITLWSSPAYRHLLLCYAVLTFFNQGIAQWQPAFFMRSHGLQSGELGSWFAAIYGVGQFLGTWLGGELAFRYAAGNERLQLAAIGVVFATFVAFNAGVYLSPGPYLAFGLLALYMIVGAMTNGPLFAATQTLVPPEMRAMSVALFLFFGHLIGMGLGPLMVGILSDTLQPLVAEESLRYALLAMSPGYLWVAWHAWQAGRTLPIQKV